MLFDLALHTQAGLLDCPVGTLGDRDRQFLKTKRAYLGHVPKISISISRRDRQKGKMARAIRHAPGRVVPESYPQHRQPLCDIQPHLAPQETLGHRW